MTKQSDKHGTGRIPKPTARALIKDLCKKGRQGVDQLFKTIWRKLGGRDPSTATHAARAYKDKGKIAKWVYSFFQQGLHEPLLA